MAKTNEKAPEQKEREKFLALDQLAKTDGGKLLIANALQDLEGAINRLSVEYRTASHIELIALCAQLDNRLALYKALTRAESNLIKLDAIIEEALKERDTDD